MSAPQTSGQKPKGTRRRAPAKTPLERENQLIAQTVDLVEAQIQSGKVSPTVLTHYLKLASSREKLEQRRLAEEISLLEIKRETINSQKKVEELYTEAMNAFRAYSGHPVEEEVEEDYDY